MPKKWYSYFIVTDEGGASVASPDQTGSEPLRVSHVAAEPAIEPTIDAAAASVDLAAVYESAKIQPPSHGYTIFKVADMLESEHIRALPPDVKRKSVMVALDAAGVTVESIVEDAVRRDRALDTYERVLEKHLEAVRAEAAAANRQIETEIEQRVTELRARVAENTQKVEREERELVAWRARKQQEEAAIAKAVTHFVTENPITTAESAANKSQGDADVR